jgi:hypothetical protein
MMEAASISETSENFYQTRRHNNPEDSHFPLSIFTDKTRGRAKRISQDEFIL